jgi:hypothetical protein
MSGIQELLQGSAVSGVAACAFSRHGAAEIDWPKQHDEEGRY